MSQSQITVRHTASDSVRETISRLIRTREVGGVETEVVMYEGRWFRVVRRGRGVFIYKNRPLTSLAA